MHSLYLPIVTAILIISAGCKSADPSVTIGAIDPNVASERRSERPAIDPPAPRENASGGARTVQSIVPPENPLPAEEASADVSKFSFLVYGDTRGRRDGTAIQYEHSLVVDSMLGTIRRKRRSEFPVRFVLQTGDAVVNGGDPRQWNVSYVELVNRLTRDGGVPYFLAPGNHDVTTAKEITAPNRLRGLKNYLAAVDQLIPPDGAPRRLDGYPTYAFGYGNTFVLAIDSNIAWDEKQYAWVQGQLEGLDQKRYTHRFAFFHHPPFSSGPHGGAIVEGPAAEIRERYMPLFRKYQFTAILTGHEHLFEHWVERYGANRNEQRRIDHIITGGGGAPLYGLRGVPNVRPYTDKYRSERVSLEHLVAPGPNPGDNPYHYVIVQVDGDAVSLEVVGIDWGRDYRPYRSRGVNLSSP